MDEQQSTKKTRQTGQSSKDSKQKRIETEMEGTNIGENITYDVLRMILEYFNIWDLTKAAMVCRSWNEAAKKEIQTRTRPQHILYQADKIKINEKLLKTFIEQLFIKPSIGLLFVGEDMKTNRRLPQVIYDYMCHHMPNETNYMMVWNYGIVHNNREEMEGNVISGLFLPNIPGVEIKCFHMSKDELDEFGKATHTSNREKLARKFCKLSPNEDVKCIILFASQERETLDEESVVGKQILKTFLPHRTNDTKNKISIWGGITNKLTVCSYERRVKVCNHDPLIAGITISGAGVSTWSIVLDSLIKTKAQAEKKLTSFRDAVKLQRYTIGFMFACCARGDEWYNEKNVEPIIFRKIFPNVPLIGTFGLGEYGVTTIPQECSKGREEISHQYSTIFLIVSYGSIRNVK